MSFIDIETELFPLDYYKLHRFSGYSIRSHIYNTVFKNDEFNQDIHNVSELRFFRITPLYTYDADNRIRIVYCDKLDAGKSYFYRFTLFGKYDKRYRSKIMDFLTKDNILLDNHKYHVVNRVIRILALKDIQDSLKESDKILVNYLSPTYFRSPKIYSYQTFEDEEYTCECKFKQRRKNINVPLPLPSLLLRNLMRLYRNYIGKVDNTFSQVFQEYINEDGVVISGYPNGIKTKVIGESEYMFNIGFQGKVYYHLTDCDQINDNKPVKNLIRLLLRIGEYTNVGGGRTAGLGWIKTELRME